VLSERCVLSAMAAEQYLSEVEAELLELLETRAQQLSADLQAVEAPLAELNDKMQLTMHRLSVRVGFFADLLNFVVFADLLNFVDRLGYDVLDNNCGCYCLLLCNNLTGTWRHIHRRATIFLP